MTKCGRCGAEFELDEDDDYNTLCPDCQVPHMLLTRLVPGRDLFRCDYCGEKGPRAKLEETECEFEYPPCDDCGGHPFCEADCAGIAEILARPDVYVAGFPPESDT